MEPNVIAAIASGAAGVLIRVLDRRSKQSTQELRSAAEARGELEKELREQIKNLEARVKECENEKKAEVAVLRGYLAEWQQRYFEKIERPD